MDPRPLSTFFDMAALEHETVLVDERLPCNCDFMVVELIKHFGLAYCTFNDAAEHMARILDRLGIRTEVRSAYDEAFNVESTADQVVDHMKTGVSLFKYGRKPRVAVFRSNTATAMDYYEYSTVIRVEGLDSGCSPNIDGQVTVLKREKTLANFRYKVKHTCEVLYFE